MTHFARQMLLWCTLSVTLHGAQQEQPVPAASDNSQIETAPVLVDGITLFSVRGLAAYPASQRAQDISDRIAAVAADRALSEASVRVEESSGGTHILADSRPIMTVLDADARLEGVERQVVARIYLARIQQSLIDFRRDREPAVLVRHAIYAFAATLIFALVVIAFRRAMQKVRAKLASQYKDKIRGVSIQSVPFVRADQLWRLLTGVVSVAVSMLLIVAGYVYLHYILSLFPWTRGLATDLVFLIMSPLRTIGIGILGTIPQLVFLAVLILITRYALLLVHSIFAAVENGSITWSKFDPEWAKPTYRLVRLLVASFALVVAYPYIPGSGSEAFKGISIFLGILFSLGSTALIGNLIAGYTMTYRRLFKPGDRVRIGEYVGDVEESRLMVTYLRTPKNELLAVPNSKLINEEVINYSTLVRKAGLILHTTVGIGYGTPWRQVEAMLLEAAARTQELLRDPQPFVLQKQLGDFAVSYELNGYCSDPRRMFSIYSMLHQNILDVFNEYGVQIMTPAYESDPSDAKVVPREKWFAAPAGSNGRNASPREGSTSPTTAVPAA